MRRTPLLALVVATTACGGAHHPSARDQVGGYIGRVNIIETGMQQPLLHVQSAVQSFAKHRTNASTAAALAGADATLARLRTRLAAAGPPPQARKLQRLLLELVDRERALAQELRALGTFDPAFAAALGPLAQANQAAQARLHGSHRATEVTSAVLAYRAAVRRARAAAGKLEPPAVERPLYTAQVARLDALDAALTRLLKAVAARDDQGIARAEHAISVASVSPDSTANQRAQRAAVQAFDAQVRSISALVRRIARERDRLQATSR